MKKIKKIGSLVVIFLLNFYNTCFADLVWIDPVTGKVQGGTPKPNSSPQSNYILIGILVLVVVISAVIIIRKIAKKKKDKENDNK